jgi:hypothetical protein
MADITDLSFVGDWRITIVRKNAGWSQRVFASGTSTGTIELAGLVGTLLGRIAQELSPYRTSYSVDHPIEKLRMIADELEQILKKAPLK